MGTYAVDGTSEPGVLRIIMRGRFEPSEMHAFVKAHNAAIKAFDGGDYRVWVDLRELEPLSVPCTEIMEKAKKFSATQPNFCGSAVLIASPLVGMQHRRTSTTGGVMDSELISSDEAELRAHLARVKRPPKSR